MLLSTLIFLPVLFALIVALWPQEKTVRHLAVGFAVIEFLLSLTIFQNFNTSI